MSDIPSFPVQWKSRVLLPGKKIRNCMISKVKVGGFGLQLDQAIAVGAEIAVEFYVKYRDEMHRIRVRATVTHCNMGQSGASGIELSLTKISREDNHTLNNVLQTLAESHELGLRA